MNAAHRKKYACLGEPRQAGFGKHANSFTPSAVRQGSVKAIFRECGARPSQRALWVASNPDDRES